MHLTKNVFMMCYYRYRKRFRFGWKKDQLIGEYRPLDPLTFGSFDFNRFEERSIIYFTLISHFNFQYGRYF